MALRHLFTGVTIGGALVAGIAIWHPFRKSTPVANQVIFTDYQFSDNKEPADGWIQISGSLNNRNLSDGSEGQPPNDTLTIQCSQTAWKCIVASIDQIGENQVSEISVNEFRVLSWSKDEITATDDSGSDFDCVKNKIIINRYSKKTFYISEPINIVNQNCIKSETGIKKLTIEDSKVWRYLKKTSPK